MTSHTISGALTLPDDTSPLVGTWYITLATLEGTARDSDGSVRAGTKELATDPTTGVASITLPDSGADEAYFIVFRSKSGKNRVELGPYQVALTANMTWSQVITQPVLTPLPEGALPAYLDQLRLNAAFEAKVSRGGAATGQVPTLQGDGTLAFAPPAGGGVALGETSSTAYRGDRGKTAYDHSQITTGNPHGTTKSDVGLANAENTSDANKPVSTAQAAAIAAERAAALRPSQLVLPARPTILNAFQSGHTAVVRSGSTGSANLNDTSQAALGSQCISVVTNGAGGNNQIDIPNIASTDMTANAIKVWLMVDPTTASNLNKLTLFTGESLSVGYSSDFLSGAPSTWIAPPGRWFTALVDLTFFASLGGATTKTITNLRLTVKDNATGTGVKVYYGGVGSVPKPTATYPNGVITLGFDDGYVDQYTNARARMDRYGFPGMAYVIQDLIPNTPSATYMGLNQLHLLEDLSGWDVCAHSYTQADHNATNGLTSLTEAQQRANFEPHKKWLLSEGFRGADHIAYPQGFYDDPTASVVNEYFSTARTIIAGTAEQASSPTDPMRMRCYPIDSSLSAATLTGIVDRVKSERSWVQFYTHRVLASGASGTQTSTATFNTLVDYINTAGVPVRTVSDVLARR